MVYCKIKEFRQYNHIHISYIHIYIYIMYIHLLFSKQLYAVIQSPTKVFKDYSNILLLLLNITSDNSFVF